MNQDRIEGSWDVLRVKIREQWWGKLTRADVDATEGRWDRLSAIIQKKYGETKDEVERELRRFREQTAAALGADTSL